VQYVLKLLFMGVADTDDIERVVIQFLLDEFVVFAVILEGATDAFIFARCGEVRYGKGYTQGCGFESGYIIVVQLAQGFGLKVLQSEPVHGIIAHLVEQEDDEKHEGQHAFHTGRLGQT